MNRLIKFTFISAVLALISCGSNLISEKTPEIASLSKSGTIIISEKVSFDNFNSVLTARKSAESSSPGPVFGYLPPSKGYLPPAKNQVWVKISKSSNEVSLMRGKSELKSFKAEGLLTKPNGRYLIEQKLVDPLWFATDEYFIKRGLDVPAMESPERYRRGAFGTHALLSGTSEVSLHDSAVWSADVGGLKLSSTNLEELTSKLSLGSEIMVVE